MYVRRFQFGQALSFYLWGISALFAARGAVAGCEQSAALAGVNIAGAEFNGAQLPGILFKNYIYPSDAEMNYFAALGATAIRLPILWERVQPSLMGDLSAEELRHITAVVTSAKSRGLCVILDLHNYGAYRDKPLGSDAAPSAAFIDVWRKLGTQFNDASSTAFGLMNEPAKLPIALWASIAQQTVDALRAAHLNNLILVSGGAWSGVHDWFADKDGQSNASAFAHFHDAARKTVIEVHQYADANFSGTGRLCLAAEKFPAMFDNIAAWAKSNGKRLFLGEFGVPPDASCLNTLDTILAQLNNKEVWRGWTYWAAGQWWGDYPLSVEPKKGVDAPQTAILKKYWSKS